MRDKVTGGQCTLQGLPNSSAQWGAWGAAGMASSRPWLAARLARLGLGLLRPQEGLRALTMMMQQAASPAGVSAQHADAAYRMLVLLARAWLECLDLDCARVCAGGGVAVALASRLIWKKLLVAGRERSPFFAEHLHAQAALATLTPHPGSGWAAVQPVAPGLRQSVPAEAAPLSSPAGRDWAAAGAALVADTVQRLLGRPLRPDEPFMSAGLDSLGDSQHALCLLLHVLCMLLGTALRSCRVCRHRRAAPCKTQSSAPAC